MGRRSGNHLCLKAPGCLSAVPVQVLCFRHYVFIYTCLFMDILVLADGARQRSLTSGKAQSKLASEQHSLGWSDLPVVMGVVHGGNDS